MNEWDDVSEESSHEFHWHYAKDSEFRSIWCEPPSKGHLGYRNQWVIELYPDPDHGIERRWTYEADQVQDAAQHVVDLMEKHS